MIYRFRIILDTHDDVIRDIEIEETSNLEDFHNALTQAFGFEGQEMASFYTSNEEWEQIDEIALFDMSVEDKPVQMMSETRVNEVVSQKRTKLIYIYDFLNMWTFHVELADIAEFEFGMIYPNLMFAQGEIPDEAIDVDFIVEGANEEGDDDDSMFDEEYDLDSEDYEDLDFDENWN
ncbi:MAG: hypothetical protein ACI83B_002945 [Sediminicola sp.]|jgi:hypothetical protein|tara:strand:+ start:7712 stop:8242 length:531 start_codon:yes stop_codon:yes gene_type:complete